MNTENKVHFTERSGPEKRLEFEKFLGNLSARLIALPPERVDDEIRNALKKVLEFFQIERLSLLQLLPDKTSWQAVYISDASGIPPYPIGTAHPVTCSNAMGS